VDDDERPGRPSEAITVKNIEKVRDFLKVSKKSSVRFLEMELGIPKTTIYRILTEAGSWRFLHDNAPSHRAAIITDFFTKN